MKNRRLSQILVLLIALSMTFAFTACGGNSGGNSGGSGSPEGSGGSDAAKLIRPSEITAEDWTVCDEGLPVEADMGLGSGSEGWTMEGTLAKLDYTDLESQKDILEKSVKEGLEASKLEGFELYSDFEASEMTAEEAEEYGVEIGDLLYTSGTEDEYMEERVIEAGAYNNITDGTYHQYTIYSSQSFYSMDEIDMPELLRVFNECYGVSCDETLLRKAFEVAMKQANDYVAPESEYSDEDEEYEEEEEEMTEEEEELPAGDTELDAQVGEDAEEGETEEIDLSDVEIDEGYGMDGMDYSCTVEQRTEVKGKGYTDTITLNIVAQKVGDGACAYASIERNRVYD